MNNKDFKEILSLCKDIGIYTLGDLEMFKRQEGYRKSTLIDCLKDYKEEVYGKEN